MKIYFILLLVLVASSLVNARSYRKQSEPKKEQPKKQPTKKPNNQTNKSKPASTNTSVKTPANQSGNKGINTGNVYGKASKQKQRVAVNKSRKH